MVKFCKDIQIKLIPRYKLPKHVILKNNLQVKMNKRLYFMDRYCKQINLLNKNEYLEFSNIQYKGRVEFIEYILRRMHKTRIYLEQEEYLKIITI